MDIKVYQRNKTDKVIKEKVYTQSEVDAILVNSKVPPSPTVQKKLDHATVENLVKKSNRILLSISSHAFFLDLFPDQINIEESRVTIINRHFLSSEVHSIDIKDISNVFINTTYFFSQLVIISKTFEENEVKTRNLLTAEAIYARRIIEGLRIFINKEIDTSIYSQKELINKLEQLSTTEIVL